MNERWTGPSYTRFCGVVPNQCPYSNPLMVRGKAHPEYGIQARKGGAERCLHARRNPLQLPAISPRSRLARKERIGAGSPREYYLPDAVSIPCVPSDDQVFDWAVRGAQDTAPIPISRLSILHSAPEPNLDREALRTGRFYKEPISRSRSGDGRRAWETTGKLSPAPGSAVKHKRGATTRFEWLEWATRRVGVRIAWGCTPGTPNQHTANTPPSGLASCIAVC